MTGFLGLRVGDWVGNFRVGRPLGRGGMGEVYLARDAVLGRDVALKFIRGGKSAGDDVRRFFLEGRATAKLNHPNIVVVYDLQQFGEHPFLVLELVRGRTLADIIGESPLPVREATRLVSGCASALAAAHDHEVLHRDFKPANVMVGDDGRPRVLDFGLAYFLNRSASTALLEGTPAYMAPEQLVGGALTPAVDVWALGLVLFECLTGRRPDALAAPTEVSAAELSAEIARALTHAPTQARLVAAALALDPTTRPRAREFAAALEAELAGTSHRPRQDGASPFPGLDAYQERDAHAFGGRDTETALLVSRMRREPIVTVVGPSGTGKTSLVLAGVIPRLRDLGAWRVLRVRPGRTPLLTLGAATEQLGHAAIAPEVLRVRPHEFGVQLFEGARRLQERILLVVDQLEELYTHDHDEADRRAFESAIARASSEADDSVRIVLTLREDFLGRAADSGELTTALRSLLAVGQPARPALRDAIRAVVEAAGYRFDDPGLVDRMMAEASGSTAPLSLVSFACRALWDRRDSTQRLLLRGEYDSMGGVLGALADEGERVLRQLTSDQQRLARSMLLRLIGPEGTRRVVARSSLAVDAASAGVLRALARARLVHESTAPGEDEPTIEIVHEALATAWRTLAGWVEESREERALSVELDEAVAAWHRRGAHPEDTWSYDSVLECRSRIRRVGLVPAEPVEEFLRIAEARELRRRRVRALATGGSAAVAILALSGVAALAWQAEKLRLARADRGRIELTLSAFDVTESGTTAAVLSDAVDIALFAPSASDRAEPGIERTAPEAELTRTGPGRFTIEAPGGPAFLRVTGRGAPGRDCGPVWIPIRGLPGYAGRERPTRASVSIPSCAASSFGMIDIPAGPFIHGGVGEPPTPYRANAAPRTEVTLRRFAIDRTEVTNRAYRVFAQMGELTGYPMIEYPETDPVRAADGPNYPVTKVTFHAGQAYCRFLGKRLPTVEEWEKAGRGGLTLDAAGRPNEAPERNVPWLGAAWGGLDKANLRSPDDGHDGPAPVGSYPSGQSPYGVLDLVGNVREWIDASTGFMRPTRGGDWDSDPDGVEHLIAYQGERDMSSTDYGQGFRCVSDK